jgi:lysozyme
MIHKELELELNLTMAEQFEGFRGMPYECPAGKITIGIGRNLEMYPYTLEEARAWTLGHLESIRLELVVAFPWVVEQPMESRVILTDMAYNIGIPRLRGFRKMLKALKGFDFPEAAEELKDSRYYRQTGNRAKSHYIQLGNVKV